MYETLRKYDLIVVLGCIVTVYVLVNFVLPVLPYEFLNTYLVRPVLWGALAFVVFKMPDYRIYGKFRARSMLTLIALTMAGFQITVMILAGLLEGFGKSPYSFTPLGIITNVFFVYGSLLGMEFSRSWLVNRCTGRRQALTIAWVALVYTFFVFPYSKFTSVNGLQGVVKLVGETLLPSFAESLFATFLAFLGGFYPTLVYRGTLQLFIWFCPVLPDLNWTSLALIGVVIPVLGFVLVQKLYFNEIKRAKYRVQKKDNFVGWIVVAILSVLILWFPTGLLGVYPTVIISGSMRPNIEIGDMIIVKKVKPELVKKGDVIQFVRKDNKIVTHRVVEIVKSADSSYFTTKGDANSIVDDPVFFPNLKGLVISKIPKIGRVSISLRQLISLKPD